jgi:hypothetical protein
VIPRLLLILSLAAALLPGAGDSANDPWKDFRFLIGDWTAGGGGSPGQAAGGFSFQLDVVGKVLLRRNFADYPAADGKPANHHEDLMMIYREAPDKSPEAVYADSEGHGIHYATEVSSSPRMVRFTNPNYRLTYRQNSDDSLSGQFEVAPPGKPEAYATYLTWTAKRK